jgi:hypothetical protein
MAGSKDTVEKMLTLHPTAGKVGRNIGKATYDAARHEMLALLAHSQPTHSEMFDALEKRLAGKIEGNISWYCETVKLDLEARKLIARTTDKPHRYKLV